MMTYNCQPLTCHSVPLSLIFPRYLKLEVIICNAKEGLVKRFGSEIILSLPNLISKYAAKARFARLSVVLSIT